MYIRSLKMNPPPRAGRWATTVIAQSRAAAPTNPFRVRGSSHEGRTLIRIRGLLCGTDRVPLAHIATGPDLLAFGCFG